MPMRLTCIEPVMEDSNGAEVKGQQRQLDPQHAERIKRYLESGDQCFLPEVILSIRTNLTEELDETQKPIGVKSAGDEDGIGIARAWKSRNIRVHRITVDRKKLADILAQKLIRRVDGNHRLGALADQLLPVRAVEKDIALFQRQPLNFSLRQLKMFQICQLKLPVYDVVHADDCNAIARRICLFARSVLNQIQK
jgi:hypothetical protein